MKTRRYIAGRILIALALLMVLSAGLLAVGCGKKSAASGPGGGGRGGPGARQAQAIPVATARLRRGGITSKFSLTGSVTPRQQANLSSIISGTVQAVTAQIGDHVGAGQLLIKIDDSTLRAQQQQDEAALQAAEARLSQTRANDTGASATTNANLTSAHVAFQNSQANLRRNQQLFAQGYVSQSAIDQAQQQFAAAQAQLRGAEVAAQNANLQGGAGSAAQADVRNAQAAVAQAQAAIGFVQAQMAQSSISAPFAGVVTQRNVDPGTLAAPSTPLMQVSQIDPVFINVGIPDNDLAYVRTGTIASVTIDSVPGRNWQGKVSYLNAATAQGTLSYLSRITIPNPDLTLRAGMVANVTFVQANRRNVLLVPRSAIVQTENGNVIYIVAGGKAKVVPVSLGVQTENIAQVQGAGLQPGTVVITQKPDALQDGSPVQVVGAKGGGAPYSSRTSR